MNEKMASYKPISPFDFDSFCPIMEAINSCRRVRLTHGRRSNCLRRRQAAMYTIVFPYPLDFYTDFPAVL